MYKYFWACLFVFFSHQRVTGPALLDWTGSRVPFFFGSSTTATSTRGGDDENVPLRRKILVGTNTLVNTSYIYCDVRQTVGLRCPGICLFFFLPSEEKKDNNKKLTCMESCIYTTCVRRTTCTRIYAQAILHESFVFLHRPGVRCRMGPPGQPLTVYERMVSVLCSLSTLLLSADWGAPCEQDSPVCCRLESDSSWGLVALRWQFFFSSFFLLHLIQGERLSGDASDKNRRRAAEKRRSSTEGGQVIYFCPHGQWRR